MPCPPERAASPLLCLAIDALTPAGRTLGELTALGGQAEAAGFDLILTGQGANAGGRLDALTLAAALTSSTRRIGLCAAVPASAWAPFNLARALASFDLLSGGRAGWLASPGETGVADPGFDRFDEYLEVVFALFDSWSDGALVFDKAASVFADAARVRRIAHHGRHFSVDGPLNAPRPIQGRPVILEAHGEGLPRMRADIVLIRAASIDEAAALRRRTRAPRVIADLAVSLAGAPLETAAPAWRGSPEGLVAMIRDWTASGAVDGFNLAPAAPAADLAILADQVLPALRADGARADAGDLRARLGLARPVNRFEA